MKTAFFFFLIGAIAGAVGWNYYQRTQNPTLSQRAGDIADKTRRAAVETKDAVSSKAADWHLTPESIKEELASTGRIVRSKAKVAGERIDDALIVAVINGKYVVEKDLSVFAISVDCREGQVKLTGSVSSAEYIGRAITIALETKGVHNVVSHLTVKD